MRTQSFHEYALPRITAARGGLIKGSEPVLLASVIVPTEVSLDELLDAGLSFSEPFAAALLEQQGRIVERSEAHTVLPFGDAAGYGFLNVVPGESIRSTASLTNLLFADESAFYLPDVIGYVGRGLRDVDREEVALFSRLHGVAYLEANVDPDDRYVGLRFDVIDA